jgi:hypothetical protein
MKSSLHSLIHFLPLFCQLQTAEFNTVVDNSQMNSSSGEPFFITTLHGHAENTTSIVKKACLLIRCLTVNVLSLRAFASAGMCLLGRCLTVGLYVTVCLRLASVWCLGIKTTRRFNLSERGVRLE